MEWPVLLKKYPVPIIGSLVLPIISRHEVPIILQRCGLKDDVNSPLLNFSV